MSFPAASAARRKKDNDLGRALSENRSPVRSPTGDRGSFRGQKADLPDTQHLAGWPLPRVSRAVADRDDRAASLSASDAARTGRGRGRRALGGQEGGRRPV